MKEYIDIASRELLQPMGLEMIHLQDILHGMLRFDLDYADLYFQNCSVESWSLEDGIVKSSAYHIDRGVGVRAVSGVKTGLAYTNVLDLAHLKVAAKAAMTISEPGGSRTVRIDQAVEKLSLYSVVNPVNDLRATDKIALLQRVDQIARQADSRVIQVNASIASAHDIIFIMSTDGVSSADIRPLVQLSVSVVVEEKGRRETGHSGCGGRLGYDFIVQQADKHAKEAVRQALVNLKASSAPAGVMPVILAAGWPGVLLHEAVGHGLEADFNRKGSSLFSGRMGQQVASSLCTIVDDGTMPHRRGSLNVDDEGMPGQYNVLIEKGILKSYMQDKLNARLMKMKPTGNARRESYAAVTIPRMTNTYMLAGESDEDDIIRSVKKGLYAVNFSGGQVDITSGNFVFTTNEAYLIEDGKITRPVKNATLIGNGPEVLGKVSMVGNQLRMDEGIGVCGKEGQNIPVGIGQPMVKVDELTVGGTN
ncbi:MAG: metalloprotease TldD [Pseudomonadota bacterium]